LAGEITRDGKYKGRLQMTYHGPLSDLHMIVYEELYFNQIARIV